MPSLLPTPSDGRRGRTDGQRRAGRGSNEEKKKKTLDRGAVEAEGGRDMGGREGRGREPSSEPLTSPHMSVPVLSRLPLPTPSALFTPPLAIQSVSLSSLSLSLSLLHNCQKVINRRRTKEEEASLSLFSLCFSVSCSIVKPCTCLGRALPRPSASVPFRTRVRLLPFTNWCSGVPSRSPTSTASIAAL